MTRMAGEALMAAAVETIARSGGLVAARAGGHRPTLPRAPHDFADSVQAATGARLLFGHSFGGFVALETARHTAGFTKVAVYEPGVTIGGSIPMGWIPQFKERLADGDPLGAFVAMSRQSGFAPAIVAKMPERYVRAVTRLAIRPSQWRRMQALLAACATEYQEQIRMDDGTVNRYATVAASVLLIGGSNSPAFITTDLFEGLRGEIRKQASRCLMDSTTSHLMTRHRRR